MKKEQVLHSEFCLHLKELRESFHMSLGDLEAASGVDRSDICNIEKGVKTPKLPKLLKLANGFNGKLRIVPPKQN